MDASDRFVLFQSTPPRREVTSAAVGHTHSKSFQSTPPRREVTEFYLRSSTCPEISIHTSPKGGDGIFPSTGNTPGNFNPHLPEGR